MFWPVTIRLFFMLETITYCLLVYPRKKHLGCVQSKMEIVMSFDNSTTEKQV